jgi:hypothetical protein
MLGGSTSNFKYLLAPFFNTEEVPMNAKRRGSFPNDI